MQIPTCFSKEPPVIASKNPKHRCLNCLKTIPKNSFHLLPESEAVYRFVPLLT